MIATNASLDVQATESMDTLSPTFQVTSVNVVAATMNIAPFIGLIVQCGVTCLASLANIFGNSLLLVVFSTTAALQTKTNRILTSLIVSDLLTGITSWFTVSYIFVGYVFGNPCLSFWVITILEPLSRLPPTTSGLHMIVIAVDRYVAICYPLVYEQNMPDRVINGLIAGAWIVGTLMSGSFYMWLLQMPAVLCDGVVPLNYYFIDTALVTLIWIVLVGVYGRITCIAWKHHIRIGHSGPTASTSASLSRVPGISRTVEESSGHQSTAHAKADNPSPSDLNTNAKRQFKAVRLTASVVGVYVVLTAPYQVVGALRSGGVSSTALSYALNVTSAIAMVYFGFNWLIYGLASSTVNAALKRVLCAGISRWRQTDGNLSARATAGAVVSNAASK